MSPTSTPPAETARPATTPLPAGLDDRCPRCGGAFHCGVGGPGPCACTTVTLSAERQRALRERYVGCLCVTCLVALARDGAAT